MIALLTATATDEFARGPFVIRRIRPGRIDDPNQEDLALGPFAMVDHADLDVGTVVRMHEHVNDEILSYLWRGTMVHEDSTGDRVELTPERLMMMNAGTSFWHEESTPDDPVEMLQIFIRPEEADLEPEVHFHDRPDGFRDGTWQHLGGPAGSGAGLTIRSRVHVRDAHPAAGATLEVPALAGYRQWLYVMDGEVEIGGTVAGKGDAVTDADRDLPALHAVTDATIVLFLTDPGAPVTRAGNFSGAGR